MAIFFTDLTSLKTYYLNAAAFSAATPLKQMLKVIAIHTRTPHPIPIDLLQW
jgi:hypothetical protein